VHAVRLGLKEMSAWARREQDVGTAASRPAVRDLIDSRRCRQLWQSATVKRTKRPDRRDLLATAHHPRRLDGAIALALALLPWVAAVILVRRHHYLDGGTVGILVAVSLGLPTLWLTWAAYRGPRRRRADLSMAEVADQLAMAVGAQWEAEAAIRRLNDPYPLPVSWTAADASLTDSWDTLVKLAASGAGWPLPPPQGTWAAGPDGLAGKGGELVEVLARVPTARLVVLGEPGSGKTMLMVRLVLDLLARRVEGGPVPILASVSSWNPAVQDLRDWLDARLLIDYPALANFPPVGRTESTRAAALLASGMILPVLDGLDEIPEQVRGPAINRINDALRPGEQVVVTCRTDQYRDAVRPICGAEVTLRGAAAVGLRPLDAEAVCGYLSDDAAGPASRARWDPVLKVLGTDAPGGQALDTPLMVGLARAIYNPRPGELAGGLRDPAEMCSPDLADRTAVESLLFDAFIPTAYRHDSAGRWKAHDAEKWLVFLADHMQRTGSSDLAWWHLPLAVPGFTLAAGTVFGAAVGAAFAAAFAAAAGAAAGAAFAGRAGVATAFGVGAGAVVGLVVGAMVGAVARVGRTESSKPTVGGAMAGTGTAARAGLATSPVLARAGRIAAVLAGSAAGVVFGNVAGLVAGVVLGLAAGVVFGVVAGVVAWVVAWVVARAVASAPFGIIRSFTLPARPCYEIARIWLALRHRLPWQLMAFLADAHRRGVLRQAGAVYQFRHIELQHRLATRDVDKGRSSMARGSKRAPDSRTFSV